LSETKRQEPGVEPTEVVRCPRCRSPIPEGTIWCPGCRLELAFCEECAAPLSIEAAACASCGAANPVARAAAAKEEAGALASGASGQAAPRGPAADPVDRPPAAGPLPGRDGNSASAAPAPGAARAGFAAAGPGAEPSPSPSPAPTADGAGGGESEIPTAEALRLFLEQYGQSPKQTLPDRPPAAPTPGTSPPTVEPAGDAAVSHRPPADPREPAEAMFTALGVEIQSARYEQGKDCLIRLRAGSRGARGSGQLELWVESPWWEAPVALSLPLSTGARGVAHHLPFVPARDGEAVITVTAILRDDRGVPLDRQVGSRVVVVESPPPPPPPIYAERLSTIFLDRGGRDGLDSYGRPDVPRGVWEPVDLRTDPWFQSRRPRFRPAAQHKAPPRLRTDRLWPRDRPLLACVQWSDPRGPVSWVASLVVGLASRLGRGDDPEVAWWLSPVPYSDRQHRRLSAVHAGLRLRHGLAWVEDLGRNGTTLAGRRLPRLVSPENPQTSADGGRTAPEPLAHGDRLDLAGVVTLRAGLLGDADGVFAAWLDRDDDLDGRLRYLLVDNRAAVPVDSPGLDGPCWITWARGEDQGPRLAVFEPDGGRWVAIGPGTTRAVAGRTIGWSPLDRPISQNELLQS
jgi:hypothetical protein